MGKKKGNEKLKMRENDLIIKWANGVYVGSPPGGHHSSSLTHYVLLMDTVGFRRCLFSRLYDCAISLSPTPFVHCRI